MAPQDGAADPFSDLVEECFDEAAFLWGRWEDELTSPTRNLDEIWSWTEERLHGALDGVRAGGAGLVEMAAQGLQSSDVHRIAVSAALLASSAEPGAVEAIASAISTAEGAQLAGMTRGLELFGSDQALRAAASALVPASPAHAGALCRLKAFRRVAAGEELITAFKSSIPQVQADAVRAARHVPARAEALITDALRSEDPTVKYAAVETGLCLGFRQAWDTAARVGRQGDAESGPYLKLLALFGQADEHDAVYAALRVPDLQAQALWALGHIGTIQAVELCLAGMPQADLSRASGEAYCWMTGADLERDGLAVIETPPDVPPFEDDDLEADLVPRPDELWATPDPDAARRHWAARQAQFAPDVRHVHGRPVTSEVLLAMVETGPMLRRPDLILELRARSRGRYDVEPRAFVRQQRRMLSNGRAVFASLHQS